MKKVFLSFVLVFSLHSNAAPADPICFEQAFTTAEKLIEAGVVTGEFRKNGIVFSSYERKGVEVIESYTLENSEAPDQMTITFRSYPDSGHCEITKIDRPLPL